MEKGVEGGGLGVGGGELGEGGGGSGVGGTLGHWHMRGSL